MHITAALLLLLPCDPPDAFDLLSPAIQAFCISLEVLDERERSYVLARGADFAADLALLRGRFRELHDAPRLADRHRFPERPLINECLAVNRAFRQQLDIRWRMAVHDSWIWKDALNETDRLYCVWDVARDAQCEYYYVAVRRQALLRLRELLGEEAYYAGQMPPWIPLWRFQEIR